VNRLCLIFCPPLGFIPWENSHLHWYSFRGAGQPGPSYFSSESRRTGVCLRNSATMLSARVSKARGLNFAAPPFSLFSWPAEWWVGVLTDIGFSVFFCGGMTRIFYLPKVRVEPAVVFFFRPPRLLCCTSASSMILRKVCAFSASENSCTGN